jgi:hypothetical protein
VPERVGARSRRRGGRNGRPAVPEGRTDGSAGAGRNRALAAGVAAVLVLTLLATLLATVRGGGGAGDDPVLTVDGSTLSRAELRNELDQIAANPGYRAARARNGQPLRVFREGSTTEYDPALVVELLNERVTFRLAAAEVARRNLVASDADRAAALAIIDDGLAGGAAPGEAAPTGSSASPPPESGDQPGAGALSGRAVLEAFGSYRDVLLAGVVDLQLLQRDLGLGAGVSLDDAARLLYDRTRDQISLQSCARHILVRAGTGGATGAPAGGAAPTPPSEAEYAVAADRAAALRARLDAGEDFAALAAAASDDPSTRGRGGDLGCAPRGRYERAFDDAVWSQPVGVVGAPVRSAFGYHLVVVSERRERTLDELLPSLRAAVRDQGQEALQNWLREASRRAAVTVDPGVGRWNADTGTVEPPGGAGTIGLTPQSGPTGTAPAPAAAPDPGGTASPPSGPVPTAGPR